MLIVPPTSHNLCIFDLNDICKKSTLRGRAADLGLRCPKTHLDMVRPTDLHRINLYWDTSVQIVIVNTEYGKMV